MSDQKYRIMFFFRLRYFFCLWKLFSFRQTTHHGGRISLQQKLTRQNRRQRHVADPILSQCVCRYFYWITIRISGSIRSSGNEKNTNYYLFWCSVVRSSISCLLPVCFPYRLDVCLEAIDFHHSINRYGKHTDRRQETDERTTQHRNAHFETQNGWVPL